MLSVITDEDGITAGRIRLLFAAHKNKHKLDINDKEIKMFTLNIVAAGCIKCGLILTDSLRVTVTIED